MDNINANFKQLAGTIGGQTVVRIGMKFNQNEPLPIDGGDKDFALKQNQQEYLGVPALTSLLLINKRSESFELGECVITVSQEKNIVVTALQGRDGTIKEYISKGDYQISIQTAVSSYDENGSDGSWPREKVAKLTEYLNKDEAIAVQSDFLNIFNIQSAVVKSYGLIQETFSNRQSFAIEMLSDEPYEIKLKEENNVSTSV